VLARTHSAGVLGIDGYVVTVESDIGPGLPGLTIVGQVGGPLYEAGVRVRAALRCCGFELPKCKQIVNVAPAEQRKDGTGVDLAIACALLVSHGVIPAASLTGVMLWGELAADGSIRPPLGTLIAAETALRNGIRVLALHPASAREAALIAGLDLLLVPDLPQLIAHLRGEAALDCGTVNAWDPAVPPAESESDLAEVCDPLVRLALEVMLAGDHHLLVHGSSGSRKSALARRVTLLLDEVGDDEALELTKIQATRSPTALVRVPQVRTPVANVSTEELLGGGRPPHPGEVSLAHQGVLVLEDLHKFSHDDLRGIFAAMDGGSVTIMAGGQTVSFPARFRLLATTPSRFLAKIPTWFLDRLDLIIPQTSTPQEPTRELPNRVRRRISVARRRQRARLAGTPWRSNADIPTSGHALDQLLLRTVAVERLAFDAICSPGPREFRRLCRVARTVADLDLNRKPGAPIDTEVMAIASQLRGLSTARFRG
jgi:magnesium chelatase family protein